MWEIVPEQEVTAKLDIILDTRKLNFLYRAPSKIRHCSQGHRCRGAAAELEGSGAGGPPGGAAALITFPGLFDCSVLNCTTSKRKKP